MPYAEQKRMIPTGQPYGAAAEQQDFLAQTGIGPPQGSPLSVSQAPPAAPQGFPGDSVDSLSPEFLDALVGPSYGPVASPEGQARGPDPDMLRMIRDPRVSADLRAVLSATMDLEARLPGGMDLG